MSVQLRQRSQIQHEAPYRTGLLFTKQQGLKVRDLGTSSHSLDKLAGISQRCQLGSAAGSPAQREGSRPPEVLRPPTTRVEGEDPASPRLLRLPAPVKAEGGPQHPNISAALGKVVLLVGGLLGLDCHRGPGLGPVG